MNTSFGKQLKMKYCKIFLFLLLMIMDVSTNAQDVTCLLNTKENNIKMDQFPDFECPFKSGYNLTFSCNGQGLILKGQREITCQSNGEWSSPFPKCEGKHTEAVTCELKSTTFGVKQIKPEEKTIFRAGESVEITCSEKHWFFGTKETSRSFTCKDNGEWDYEPVCAVSEKCGPPPDVNDADTIELKKNEYNTGERVEYSCFNKYTLDLHPSFSKYLTCEQGEWRGKIRCLKPCTVTVEEMERRGIELAYTNRQKMFIPHNDHITFMCQRGKVSRGVPPRQQCNDGVITLPECVRQ